MSGHSKWKNIMHKKEKTDAQRAKVFTKVGKEISIAVREGGADPTSNTKLRDLIAKAKSLNVPNDNIKRIIDKAGADGVVYEEYTYEGYGPAGVAVIVTSAQGCVSFMFSDKGLIVINNEDGDYDEDKVMEDALEAGAADFISDGDLFEIYTEPEDLDAVKSALEGKYTFDSAEVTKVPSSYVTLENEDDIKNMENLIESLEDDDDVQDVYHNWETND